MIRYILGLKTEPSQCGMSCPCNTDSYVEPLSDEDRAEIAVDVRIERAADAADRGE